MVQRRGASSEVASLQKDINKLFEQLAQLQSPDTGGLGLGEWFPSVDVFETPQTVVVKVEAPGFLVDDLSVIFRGHKMVISGEKKQPEESLSASGYLCLERSFGAFNRSVYIDQAVDFTKAGAKLERGVLTVTMPKLQDRRGSEIRLNIEDVQETAGEVASESTPSKRA